MGHNTFGNEFCVTTFGESHGPGIGLVIDGIQSGFPIDFDAVGKEMDRRRPGGNPLGTARKEADAVQVLSGMCEGRTTGVPLALFIPNAGQHSSDYDALRNVFRPGHADATYEAKYGLRDWRGGGRSSARETAARVAAGAIAKQILATHGIRLWAGCVEIAGIKAVREDWSKAADNPLRCPDEEAAKAMQEAILQARAEDDSVGGIVSCTITGVPAGLGDPEFDKLDARLAQAMLSINASKGIEFGDGFEAARKKGSENNDQMDRNGYRSNHAGGILGGISDGMPISFRVAFKPTPSISLPQRTVTRDGEETTLVIKGRHDPCVCPRAVVVVEAMAAITILDAWYAQFGRN